jgi:hypothetical protein
LRQNMPAGKRSKKSRARASLMAGEAIDKMADRTATAGERAARRRRLIRGPREFRTLRKD